MQDRAQKKSGLGLKVLLGFSITFLAVGIGGYINFESLNQLAGTVKKLSEPDPKLIFTKQLLTDLSDQENSVRAYSLTHNVQYLDAYQSITDSIHYNLARIDYLTVGNKKQEVLTDSITRQVIKREALFNVFLENNEKSFPDQVTAPKINYRIIHSKKPESSPSNEIVTADTEKKIGAPPPPPVSTASTDTMSEDKKSTSFFGKIKNIFSPSGNKNEKKPTTENEIKSVSVPDSPHYVAPVSGTQTKEQKIQTEQDNLTYVLAQEQKELSQAVKVWSDDELQLLQEDKTVMDKIRLAIAALTDDEEKFLKQQADEANIVADNTTHMLAIIGVLGILATLLFIYLIFSDITRSNQLKEQLVEERIRAEKLAKVKEEFLANMSHEIRTPLNSIMGFAEQLSKQNGSGKQHQYVHAIQQSSDHLVSIVNEILDFSKLGAGMMKRQFAPFDFHDLIRQVFETFRIKATEKNIFLSYNMEKNVPHYVTGDALSVKQILLNLVSNGIKFTEQGSVEIHCGAMDRDGDSFKMKIAVRDTGIGISEDMKEKIFEEFTQSENEMTRKYGGTGLGLAISKKLTELLKGTIEVESNAGNGSVFTVIIPLTKCEEIAAGEKLYVPVLHHSILQDKSILLVDDEEMNVLLGQTILENWGVKTETARSGKEALEKFHSHSFDLVLLDIHMPEVSGVEVARAIRASTDEKQKRVPIIALTANVFSGQLKNVADAGFDDILIKPFKEMELFNRISHALKLLPGNGIENEALSNGEEHAESGKELFSLHYLENTSGSNLEFEIKMLQSFVENNAKHVEVLKEALSKQDWDAIYRLAHKMIPQFAYLQIVKTEEKLKLLEHLSEEKKHVEKIPGVVNSIVADTNEVLESLKVEIKRLQNESDNSVASELINDTNQK